MRPGRRRGPGCGWPTWPPAEEKDAAAKAGLRVPAVCARASPCLCGAPTGRLLQLPTRIARAMSFEFVNTVREREIYIYVHFPPRAALGGSTQERRNRRNPGTQRRTLPTRLGGTQPEKAVLVPLSGSLSCLRGPASVPPDAFSS